MKFDLYTQSNLNTPSKKSIIISISNHPDNVPMVTEFMRFEEKKDLFIWADADEICFVKSADHYIKALIKSGDGFKWATRHSTVKELLQNLDSENFIRLNRFYLLNLTYYSHIDQSNKTIFLKNNFSVEVPHRISPYLLHMLKHTYT